ncbi:MAG: hypothetical protein LUE93_05630 [Bacteroides sp.]|nr:hypothetical protein [Bacteroides sp.]
MRRAKRRNGYRLIGIVYLLVSLSFQLSAATYRVSHAEELSAGNYLPGDTILLLKGDWQDQHLQIIGEGTSEKPILFLAKEAGKVVFRGGFFRGDKGSLPYRIGALFSTYAESR